MHKVDAAQWMSNRCLLWATLLLVGASIIFTVITLFGGSDGTAPAANSLPREVLDDVYERRMQFAVDGTAKMEINLKLQGILVIISILLLARSIGASRTITVLGTEVSSGMLRLVELLMPIGLLYLWIEFGYLFLDLIDNRIILLKLIEMREAGTTSLYSSKYVLPDHFFMLDPWFYLFDRTHVASFREGHILWISFFKMLVFTAFLGASHASSLALICHFSDRSRFGKWMNIVFVGYIIVVVLAITSTHLEFNVVGKKPNYGQYLIFAWAIVLTVLFANIRKLPLQRRALPKS